MASSKDCKNLLKKMVDYDDPTMINLARLNLIEYLVLPDQLSTALEEVEVLIQSAKDKNAKITEIQGLIIKAAIKTKDGDFTESLQLINLCLQETEERGLSPIHKDAMNLQRNILVLKETGGAYDQVDRLNEKQPSKWSLTTEDVAEYISRAKSVVASMES